MAFKLKALVAALAVAAAGSASADITTPDELFLNIYDATAGVTFVKDLGVLGANLVSGTVAGQTWSFGSDANWLSFKAAAGADALIYNVVSLNTATNNYVTTYTDLTKLSSLTNGNMKLKFPSVMPYVNAIAPQMVGSTYSYVKGAGDDAGDYGFGFNNWGGQTTFNSAAAPGTNLSFAKLAPNGASSSTKVLVTKGPASEYFSMDASAGALTLTAPVPEPSEWALMLAGLMCIGAIARRRTAR